MKTITTIIKYGIAIFFFASCNRDVPNGHYHLEWGKETNSFQTWNIVDGRMAINGPVLHDSTGFFSKIGIEGNHLVVDPWVDITWTPEITKEEDGVFYLDDGLRPLILAPHINCKSSSSYLQRQTRDYCDSFEMLSIQLSSGRNEWPKEADNELILGQKDGKLLAIYNGVRIEPVELPITKESNNEIWLYIDARLKLNQIALTLANLDSLGYEILIASTERIENDEQVVLVPMAASKIEHEENEVVITSCDYCGKHPDEKIMVKPELIMVSEDICVFNGDTNNINQTRNSIERFLVNGRTNRIHSQIQVSFGEDLLFSDFLVLRDKLNFARYAAATIIYYRNTGDVDEKWILKAQEDYKHNTIMDEFPLRLRQTIKSI